MLQRVKNVLEESEKFLKNSKVIQFLCLLIVSILLNYISLYLIIKSILFMVIGGLLFQLLFPAIPLKTLRIIGYTLSIIFIVTTLSVLDSRKDICQVLGECTKIITSSVEKNTTMPSEGIIKKDKNGSK